MALLSSAHLFTASLQWCRVGLANVSMQFKKETTEAAQEVEEGLPLVLFIGVNWEGVHRTQRIIWHTRCYLPLWRCIDL